MYMWAESSNRSKLLSRLGWSRVEPMSNSLLACRIAREVRRNFLITTCSPLTVCSAAYIYTVEKGGRGTVMTLSLKAATRLVIRTVRCAFAVRAICRSLTAWPPRTTSTIYALTTSMKNEGLY